MSSLGPRPVGDVGAMLAAAEQLVSAAAMLQGSPPVRLVNWQSPAAEAARDQVLAHIRALDTAGDDARTGSRVLKDAAQDVRREQAAWDRAKEQADLKKIADRAIEAAASSSIPANKI